MQQPFENLVGKEFTWIEQPPKPTREVQCVLTWDDINRGYGTRTAYYTTVKTKMITFEEWVRWRSFEIKDIDIFPEFKEDLHIVSCWGDLAQKNRHMNMTGALPITLEMKKTVLGVELPGGTYELKNTNDGIFLCPVKVMTDNYIKIRKEDSGSLIYEEVVRFFGKRSVYEEEGVRHRSGALLYGPPGNGKSVEICKVLNKAKEDNFIVILISSGYETLLGGLNSFRECLTGKNVIFVLEELTERVTNSERIECLLSFLDGELSWNNCFVLATTNYPEKLPYNVIDRPGRFKLLIEFGNPNYKERLAYLTGRKIEKEAAERIAKETEGFSVDYLSQLITQSRVEAVNIEYLIKQYQNTKKVIKACFSKKGTMGFSRGEKETH